MQQTQVALCAALALVAPALAQAQAQTETQTQPQPSDADRARLEEEIAQELGGKPGATSAPPAEAGQGQPAPSGAPAQGGTGGNPLARLLLMPDLSAIASFAGAWDGYDVERRSPARGELLGKRQQPTFLFQEVELGLQSVVDPYFRADVFVSFSPGGVDVEEAYATTLSLPANLQLRAGKLFSPFGRLNQQHPHVWEFVDPPLARGRLLATETLSGPGVASSWLAPLPWFAQVELAAQTTAPYDGQAGELTGVGRLLQYFTLSEALSAGVGLSAARRREGTPGAFRDLGAVDVYLRNRPVSSRSYLAVQGELYLRRFHGLADPAAAGGALPSGSKVQGAGWAQAFWRRSEFVGYGVRYDQAPTAGSSAPGTERRVSAVLDWYPSEFTRVALQPSWDRLPGGKGGLEGLVHFEWAMGAHGAHPF
jgi:hypothetical protein